MAAKQKIELKIEDIKDYHLSKALNRSKLLLLCKNPAYYKFVQEHPEEPTDSLIIGNAVHTYILEPKEFKKRYAIAPIVDKRTSEGKTIWNNFCEKNHEKIILTQENLNMLKEMKKSIKKNQYACKLLAGQIEQSFYWLDDLTKLRIKTRPDSYLNLKKQIICADLKTCHNADTETFSKEAIKHGYDVQAFMCSYALKEYYHKPVTFVFVAIEKKPPYSINIMQVDDLFRQHGEDRFRELLGIYKQCKDSNTWYDYNGIDNKFNLLSLPSYLSKNYE